MKITKFFCALLLVFAIFASSAVTMASVTFISSPTGKGGVELEEAIPEDPDVGGYLIVTPYSDRADLSEDAIYMMETAYAELQSYEGSLYAIIPGLEEIAEENGIDEDNLAVSNVFDISYVTDDGIYTELPCTYSLKLSAGELEHFVALVHYNEDGTYEIVPADIKDEYLVFTTDKRGTFAIIVEKEESTPSSEPTSEDTTEHEKEQPTPTGDSFPWIYVVLMAASAVGLIGLFFIHKGNKNHAH